MSKINPIKSNLQQNLAYKNNSLKQQKNEDIYLI